LPAVDRKYSAYDVAMAFHKAGILVANSVSIEKNKGKYNRVYIGITMWHDTEASYNFIKRLRNNKIETKFIYNNKNELWWSVYINKFPQKLQFSERQKRTTTVFAPAIFKPLDDDFEQESFEEDLFVEKYDWVDKLLEKMESDERYRYELPSLEDDSIPMF
jgi:hypothetical protein